MCVCGGVPLLLTGNHHDIVNRLCRSVNHSAVSDSLHPVDGSLPISSILGILQASMLEWVAISFSRSL